MNREREILKKYAHRVVHDTNNCHGFGVELDPANYPILVVYVQKRKHSHRWLEKLRLDGLPVIVKEQAIMKAFAADRTIQHRPAPGGVSIGLAWWATGTLGMLVEKSSTTYILSCNHVLANKNDADIGDDILQPGTFDGGMPLVDKIGELAEYVTIDFGGGAGNPNHVDAALALPTSESLVTNKLLELCDSVPTHWAEPTLGMRIAKSGRTTGTTRGQVIAFWSGQVDYGGGDTAWFDDQIITSPSFAGPGDSGSAVIIDPFKDIAYHAPTQQIIVKQPNGMDICISCCTLPEPEVGEKECPFCSDEPPDGLGVNTPVHLKVTILLGVNSCNKCYVGDPGTSFKLGNVSTNASRPGPADKAIIGLLFAGDPISGLAVCNRMSKVVDELNLDMEEFDYQMHPVPMVLKLEGTGEACRWENWDIITQSFSRFFGDFGTVYEYASSEDCTGAFTTDTLDTIEFVVQGLSKGWWQAYGWVWSAAFGAIYAKLFFGNENFNEVCASMGVHDNQLECAAPGNDDFEGGSAQIEYTYPVWAGAPVTFPVESDKQEYPAKLQMAKSLAAASAKHIRSGFKTRTKEEQARIMKICAECEYFEAKTSVGPRCRECGCVMSIKKTWSTSNCRIGKW